MNADWQKMSDFSRELQRAAEQRDVPFDYVISAPIYESAEDLCVSVAWRFNGFGFYWKFYTPEPNIESVLDKIAANFDINKQYFFK